MTAQHILVVDDDPETLTLVGIMLEGQGYRVSRALTGQEAVQQALQDTPDLIILDVMMPGEDGYVVAQRLRADAGTAHVPILMFTAKGLLDDRVAGYESGVDDYVTKPAHPAELLSRVKSVLARTARQATLGRIVACMGTTPGAGTTTVALNTAVALAGLGGRVVLAEVGQGPSSLRWLANVPRTGGLPDLLDGALTAEAAADVLVPYVEGLSLLPGLSSEADDKRFDPELAVRLVDVLAGLGGLVVLDLGSRYDSRSRRLAALAERLVLVTEPTRSSLSAANSLVQALQSDGLEIGHMCLVMVHHTPPERAYNYEAVQAGLGVSQLVVIPADPELMEGATEAAYPPVLLEPESALADQFYAFAGELRERLG